MAPLQLRPLGERTAYVPSLSNVGVWDGPAGAVLIDAGNDAEAGRRLLKMLEAEGRRPAAVALTHSNADHMGGAAFIASRAAVPVYASRIEAALCEDPLLEPSFLWGAFPPPELRGKFFMATACATLPLDLDAALPTALAGLTVLPLGGHFFGQIGFLAGSEHGGGILFAGDAVFGPESLAKHPLFFVYDVAAFLESLVKIETSGAHLVVPSHGDPTEDLAGLCAANRAAVERIAVAVIDACAASSDGAGGASAEDVLALLCPRFGIELGWAQYALVLSTVRSFLVYLRASGELEAVFADGRLRWRRV